MLEVWDLWFSDAGATGISFARSRVNHRAAGNRLLVHAAPPTLEVTVRDQDGKLLAHGQVLERGQPGPMSYLVRQDDTILLEDGWPTQDDLGRLVILPGGRPASSRPGGMPATTASGAGRSSSITTPEPTRPIMSYGHTITLDLPFQDAITRVKDAFAIQGVAP